MDKYEYYNDGKKSIWFPDRRKNPWRRIKRWVPSRIEYLNSIGIPADIDNYPESVELEATSNNIVLILDKLRMEIKGEDIIYRCNVCNKVLQAEKLDSCRRLNPEFIPHFYRERKAIEQAFLNEHSRKARSSATPSSLLR